MKVGDADSHSQASKEGGGGERIPVNVKKGMCQPVVDLYHAVFSFYQNEQLELVLWFAFLTFSVAETFSKLYYKMEKGFLELVVVVVCIPNLSREIFSNLHKMEVHNASW